VACFVLIFFMSGCLSKADCPNVFAVLRKYKCVQPRIQKPNRPNPYFPIIFPVVDHEQCRFEIKIDHPSKRYPVLLPIDPILRTVKDKLHTLIVYTISYCVKPVATAITFSFS
jgi:hypothetical protein